MSLRSPFARLAYLAFAGALSLVMFAAMLRPEFLGFDPAPVGVVMGFVMVKLPGFSNVGVSQIAIANIPRGVAYRALVTDITDNAIDPTRANIKTRYKRWTVKINGITKIDLTGTLLDEVNGYHGHADENGVMSIYFVQPKQATLASEDAMLYGTANVQTFTLEVDIDATAVGPVLALYGYIDPRPLPLGAHRITQTLTEAPGGVNAAYQVLNYAPRVRGRFLEKLHYKASANAINAARVIVNQQDVYLAKTKIAKSVNGAAYIPFTWQTGYFHVDFTQTRRLSDALHLNMQDLRVELDVSGAMTLIGIWEMIDAVGLPANSLAPLGMKL